MDALVAIDALDDLIHNAPHVLLSGDVRVDPQEVGDVLEQLRTGLVAEVLEADRSASWQLLEGLERYVRAARPARLGRGVRVDPEALYEMLDRLRATAPAEIRRSTGR